MKQAKTIYDLAVIPYIIAERAIWNVLEADKRFKELEPLLCAAIVEDLHKLLVLRAEIIYKHSEHFRKQMNDKRKDQRYTLEMFMEHWTMGLLRGETANSLRKTYQSKIPA